MLSEQLLNLGRIHWFLLYADKLMSDRMFEPHAPGKIHPVVRTDFGKEVENDPINWWVFKREHELGLFRYKTQNALDAAQILKEAADKLSKPLYDSMKDLDRKYTDFAKQYSKEITEILEYVRWLHQKDELAPTILFNYRTWGSTRMSDRTTEVNLKDLDDVLKVETLTLIVLGLIQRGWKTFDRVKSEIEYEESEKIDPETYSGKPLRIDSVNVQRRAAHDASREFAEFFKHLRDSLRNVILDVEKQEMQERLFTSDDFWRSFIVKAANSPKTEQVNWDFKQTLDMWHIKKGDPEKVKKENKFAEIVAGFANKKGGVIIVGVTDTSPRQIVGLKRNSSDVENYMKYTAKVIRQYISYEKDFFHLQQVNVPTPDHNVNLCLVIVIQQTTRTIGVKGLDGKSYSYPLREETGLVWKDEGSISSNKLGIKSDNFNFLSKLQQFMNQEL